MNHVHLRLLRLAGDVRLPVAGTAALGLAITTTWALQAVLRPPC